MKARASVAWMEIGYMGPPIEELNAIANVREHKPAPDPQPVPPARAGGWSIKAMAERGYHECRSCRTVADVIHDQDEGVDCCAKCGSDSLKWVPPVF